MMRRSDAGRPPGDPSLHQIKLFKGIETELSSLEREINAWLKESGASVVSVMGNIAPQTPHAAHGPGVRTFTASDVFVAVLYQAR
jgi:hypothetical protein